MKYAGLAFLLLFRAYMPATGCIPVGNTPFSGFVANLGQIVVDADDEKTELYADFKGARLSIIRNGLIINTEAGKENRLEVSFERKNKTSGVSGGEIMSYNNYFLPNCPPEGITQAPVYEAAVWNGIYKNTDARLYLNKNNELELDFILAPGAMPKDIELSFSKNSGHFIDSEGNIAFDSPFSNIKILKPEAYQIINSDTVWIETRYAHNKTGNIIFLINEYDKSLALIIDPVTRIWGTYYGGDGEDIGKNAAVDWNGAVYLCGETKSSDNIASPGAFDESFSDGYTDIFIAKFDLNGNRLWATYIGGEGAENAYGIAVDLSGSVYIAGETSSSQGIAHKGFQNNKIGSSDAFLIKLDNKGARLWGTYYGGAFEERACGVACDAMRNVYISGLTKSETGIATDGAFQTYLMVNDDNLPDAFIAKFNAKGERQWGTYYGGSRYDEANGIDIDVKGNLLISGTTWSAENIASENSYQKKFGGAIDAFFAKFSADGKRLFGSYFGGAKMDQGRDIGIDYEGNFYICGYTQSVENIAFGDYANSFGGENDCFIAKFNSNGEIIRSSYFGGEEDDKALSLAIDINGGLYVSGYTKSKKNISTIASFGSSAPDFEDGFAAKFAPGGEKKWSLYYGGPFYDYCYDIEVDNDKNIFLAGKTESLKGIEADGFRDEYSGGRGDAFLIRIADDETYFREVNPNGVYEGDANTALTINPNPVGSQAEIKYFIDKAAQTELYISDNSGKITAMLSSKTEYPGAHIYFLDLKCGELNCLSSGVYFLNLKTGGRTQTVKFQVER